MSDVACGIGSGQQKLLSSEVEASSIKCCKIPPPLSSLHFPSQPQMFFKQLSAFLATVIFFGGAIAKQNPGMGCTSTSKSFIGENFNVVVEFYECRGRGSSTPGQASIDSSEGTNTNTNSDSNSNSFINMDSNAGNNSAAINDANAVNVCGNQCDTKCYDDNTPPPYFTPSDCQVIYNAIWYESQRNVGGQQFVIPAANQQGCPTPHVQSGLSTKKRTKT